MTHKSQALLNTPASVYYLTSARRRDRFSLPGSKWNANLTPLLRTWFRIRSCSREWTRLLPELRGRRAKARRCLTGLASGYRETMRPLLADWFHLEPLTCHRSARHRLELDSVCEAAKVRKVNVAHYARRSKNSERLLAGIS